MDLDLAQYAVLLTVIAGVVELLTRLRARDMWVVASIVSAAVVGGVFGATGYYPSVDVAEGIALGFGASGALKALSVVGNKSTPAPSKVLEK